MKLPDRLLTIREMAEILNVSELWLRKKVQMGEIPPTCWTKIGQGKNAAYRFWPQRVLDHLSNDGEE